MSVAMDTTGRFYYQGIRALILAMACWVLSTPLTTVGGSVAAAVGCLGGCLLVDRMRPGSTLLQTRTPAVIVVLAVLVTAIGMLAGMLTANPALAGLIGAMPLYHSGQFLFWFALAAAVASTLR